MATDLPAQPSTSVVRPRGNYFTPYKRGQGFWTRLGTGIGAGLIILFTTQFLFNNLPAWTQVTRTTVVDAGTLQDMRDARSVRVIEATQIAEGWRVVSQSSLLARDSWPLYLTLTGFILGLSLLAWWLINRPRHADFLINTDGEMRKVTWTGRRELVGSTKVVILFMFFVAAVLFAYDIVFGYVFYYLDVLKIRPLGL